MTEHRGRFVLKTGGEDNLLQEVLTAQQFHLGIQILFGGKLARIDTGISRAYGGPLTWLEISGGQMIPHTAPRSP